MGVIREPASPLPRSLLPKEGGDGSATAQPALLSARSIICASGRILGQSRPVLVEGSLGLTRCGGVGGVVRGTVAAAGATIEKLRRLTDLRVRSHYASSKQASLLLGLLATEIGRNIR